MYIFSVPYNSPDSYYRKGEGQKGQKRPRRKKAKGCCRYNPTEGGKGKDCIDIRACLSADDDGEVAPLHGSVGFNIGELVYEEEVAHQEPGHE